MCSLNVSWCVLIFVWILFWCCVVLMLVVMVVILVCLVVVMWLCIGLGCEFMLVVVVVKK